MRCKQCEYRLWNLPSRVCPECGTDFLPSEFEFIANSVAFHCPHCQQSYFGTGEKGHLVPYEFECVSCRRSINMDEMVLIPTEGVEEEQTNVDTMPWLERSKRGVVKSWFSTVRRALVQPGRLIRTVPAEGSTAAALWFALLTNTFIALVALGPFVLIPLVMGLTSSGASRGGAVVSMGFAYFGVVVGGATFATLVFLALWGFSTHAILRVTGKTEGTLGRTFQSLGFSAGANAVSAVPCIGFYFGWIWWVVSAVIMVRVGQQVRTWRAAFAVASFPVIVILLIGGLYASLFYSMSSGGGVFGTTFYMVGHDTQNVLSGLQFYADDHLGHGPDHAVELFAGDYVASWDFVASSTDTTEDDVPVVDIDLARFAMLPQNRREELVKKMLDALPVELIAHRFGDFVFVYHGIDMNNCDPWLWTVVLSPDPDVNTVDTATVVVAGLCSGTAMSLAGSTFTTALAEQNNIRAKYKLAPLPDLRFVTHAKPVVAGGSP